jgi:hypothetical protein
MALDGLSAMVYLLRGKGSFFVAVCRAHFHFWKNRRRLAVTSNTGAPINGMYEKSIVWKFFTQQGKLRFSDLFI